MTEGSIVDQLASVADKVFGAAERIFLRFWDDLEQVVILRHLSAIGRNDPYLELLVDGKRATVLSKEQVVVLRDSLDVFLIQHGDDPKSRPVRPKRPPNHVDLDLLRLHHLPDPRPTNSEFVEVWADHNNVALIEEQK